MKLKTKQQLPPGWSEKKIRKVIDYYDHLTEDDWVELIESAPEVDETWMLVPTELVSVITQLIESRTGSKKRKNEKPLSKRTTKRLKRTPAKTSL